MASDVLPANCLQPLWVTDLGDDAIDLASLCGLHLDEWQQEILRTSLGMGADDRFSARQMLLLVPRQQGKNITIEARELAGLFLLHEKIMLHTAHEYKTAVSSYRRMKEWIDQAGSALPHYSKIRWRENTTETSIYIPKVDRGGDQRESSFLQFTPRTSAAGRGLTVELLVVDEAYEYTASAASALAFTQNQSKNPQSWITSSTGFPESTELLALRELGLSAELDNLGFFEFKADDDCDPGDKSQWRKALPGLVSGRQRISEIEAHYAKAKALGDFTDFNREILGLWATNDIPSLIPAPLWHSLKVEDLDSWVAPDEFAFGVQVSPATAGRQRTYIYACGQDELGFYHVWNVADDDDILWAADFLKIQQERRKPRVTVIDPGGPASALLPLFDDAGVQYTCLKAQQGMAASAQSEALIRDSRVRHSGQDEALDEAVRQGVRRWIGNKGAWVWAPKNEFGDVAALEAMSFAMFALQGVDPAETRSGGWW